MRSWHGHQLCLCAQGRMPGSQHFDCVSRGWGGERREGLVANIVDSVVG